MIPLALAGCGNGHGRSVPLTARALAQAADSVCRHATTRSDLIARLHALRPPQAEQDLYSRWLSAERDALALARARAHAKRALDPRVILAIDEGKIAGYARRLGADECARRAAGTLPP